MPTARSLAFGCYTVFLLLASVHVIEALIEFSLADRTAASQILIVPFISAALILMRWRTLFRGVQSALLPGGILVAIGLVVLILRGALQLGAGDTNALALSAAGILLVWLGGFLMFYGTKVFRAALFPLLFLFFAVPIPPFILSPTIAFLQKASADAAYVLMGLTGTPVYREDFTFAMPGLVIEIAPECSGIRSGLAMIMTSLLAGHLMLSTWLTRVALVLTAIPLLIVKNAIRIDTLSLLSIHIDPDIIHSRLHHEGGILFFILGLLLLYPVFLLLRRMEGSGVAYGGWPTSTAKSTGRGANGEGR